ncbi:MAG: FadR family transcriptional regulator [Clostridia bacterium]|nr:FadR family transcriptional regulator [Clostridia bacterium]
MEVTPIIAKQKYESIADQIILLIRNHTFSEGSHLPTEADLANMFQVGRSSVREAIKSLQMAGILTSTAGRGTFVSENAMIAIAHAGLGELILDESALSELIEVRCILEPAAAALAAKLRTDEDISKMHDAIVKMETSNDKQQLLKYGYQFHLALISACKNRIMIQLHDSMALQLLKMREKDFLTSEIYKRDSATHREILNAIIEQKEDLAKTLMLQHLTTDYAAYKDMSNK